MDQRILLQTADSFLATYTVGEPDMIEQCVAEVKGQLVQRRYILSRRLFER